MEVAIVVDLCVANSYAKNTHEDEQFEPIPDAPHEPPPVEVTTGPAAMNAFTPPCKVPPAVTHRVKYLQNLCDDLAYQALLHEHMKDQVRHINLRFHNVLTSHAAAVQRSQAGKCVVMLVIQKFTHTSSNTHKVCGRHLGQAQI